MSKSGKSRWGRERSRSFVMRVRRSQEGGGGFAILAMRTRLCPRSHHAERGGYLRDARAPSRTAHFADLASAGRPSRNTGHGCDTRSTKRRAMNHHLHLATRPAAAVQAAAVASGHRDAGGQYRGHGDAHHARRGLRLPGRLQGRERPLIRRQQDRVSGGQGLVRLLPLLRANRGRLQPQLRAARSRTSLEPGRGPWR